MCIIPQEANLTPAPLLPVRIWSLTLCPPQGFILTLIWVSGPAAPPSSPPSPPSPHPGSPSIHLPPPSKLVARARTHVLYVRKLCCDLCWFDAFFKLINLCGKKSKRKEQNMATVKTDLTRIRLLFLNVTNTGRITTSTSFVFPFDIYHHKGHTVLRIEESHNKS